MEQLEAKIALLMVDLDRSNTSREQLRAQLAEARERAAKAETEATFLRERVADLRAERDELRTAAAPPPPAPAAPPEPPPPLMLRLYRQWRNRSAAP